MRQTICVMLHAPCPAWRLCDVLRCCLLHTHTHTHFTDVHWGDIESCELSKVNLQRQVGSLEGPFTGLGSLADFLLFSPSLLPCFPPVRYWRT